MFEYLVWQICLSLMVYVVTFKLSVVPYILLKKKKKKKKKKRKRLQIIFNFLLK